MNLGTVLDFVAGQANGKAINFVARVTYQISRITAYGIRDCKGPQPLAWKDLTQREQERWMLATKLVLESVKEGNFDEREENEEKQERNR